MVFPFYFSVLLFMIGNQFFCDLPTNKLNNLSKLKSMSTCSFNVSTATAKSQQYVSLRVSMITDSK